jgi:hypothetical protein
MWLGAPQLPDPLSRQRSPGVVVSKFKPFGLSSWTFLLMSAWLMVWSQKSVQSHSGPCCALLRVYMYRKISSKYVRMFICSYVCMYVCMCIINIYAYVYIYIIYIYYIYIIYIIYIILYDNLLQDFTCFEKNQAHLPFFETNKPDLLGISRLL